MVGVNVLSPDHYQCLLSFRVRHERAEVSTRSEKLSDGTTAAPAPSPIGMRYIWRVVAHTALGMLCGNRYQFAVRGGY